jgi:DNA repair protein RadA/Sms
VRLADVGTPDAQRFTTSIEELDRTLGGGLVTGSVVLLGGEPGIGKSTLVLQALAATRTADRRALLVTGEESAPQVRTRAERLGRACGEVEVLAETRLEAVVAALESDPPAVCAIDSVQTLWSEDIDGTPGSVTQVRAAAAELVRLAKRTGTALLVVGQVTKEGALAGPRLLEHLVDCVLTFEGDATGGYRVLRATKNRFGSTNETGILEMTERGLRSVDDPSALFLSDLAGRVGACAFPAIEGSRVLVVEIQALVSPSHAESPRRQAVGVDRARLAQIVAVLARHGGIRLGDHDIFVSVAGGGRALDPAADLAIALAIAGAHKRLAVNPPAAVFGELDLTGAVRAVGHFERRVHAVSGTGIRAVIGPESHGAPTVPAQWGAVVNIAGALETAFPR